MAKRGAGNPLLYIALPSGQQGGRRSGRTLLIGSWNARGCRTCETKGSEIGSVMLEQNLVVLALSETKVKGKGARIFRSVVGRVSGVVKGNAREGVALHLSKRWLEGVVEYSEVSAWLMWVKAMFGGEFWVFVSAYGPWSERSD